MNRPMSTVRAALAISILGFLLAPPASAGAPPADKANWDNLKQLSPGQEARVVLNDAKSFKGFVESISDEAIVLRVDRAPMTFPRQTVLRVSARGLSRRGRNALIGAGIGAGVGVGMAALTEASSSETGEVGGPVMAASAALFGLLGAGVGALFPTAGWTEVYRAR